MDIAGIENSETVPDIYDAVTIVGRLTPTARIHAGDKQNFMKPAA